MDVFVLIRGGEEVGAEDAFAGAFATLKEAADQLDEWLVPVEPPDHAVAAFQTTEQKVDHFDTWSETWALVFKVEL